MGEPMGEEGSATSREELSLLKVPRLLVFSTHV